MLVLTHHCSKAPDNWESDMDDEEAALEEVDELEQVTSIFLILVLIEAGEGGRTKRDRRSHCGR